MLGSAEGHQFLCTFPPIRQTQTTEKDAEGPSVPLYPSLPVAPGGVLDGRERRKLSGKITYFTEGIILN
jgi:hypothetical protein